MWSAATCRRFGPKLRRRAGGKRRQVAALHIGKRNTLQTAQLNIAMTGASEPQPQGEWLHRYATLAAFCTLVLIAAGALVTSNDAGLSIPDWPLSYGKLVPPLIGGIRYEWTHRAIAGTVGMLTLGLAAWLIVGDSRRWMRRLDRKSTRLNSSHLVI